MKFRVYGEYGPIASMCVEEFIEAETSEQARQIFIEKWRKQESTWKRMGEHNVYADKNPVAEKKQPKINKQEIFRELCILHGVFPNNVGSNICAGDGYYAQSLERKHGISIREMEKLIHFDKYVKTLAEAEKIVHTAFTNNMKKGN